MINIEVQHCRDCPTHSWCSRHNEEKYHEFYRKLQVKAQSLVKGVSIISNHFSSQSLSKNYGANLTKDGFRQTDDRSKELSTFPRHGAFEIRVNGILIFSKLQSNLWPNLQKVGTTLLEIAQHVKAGRDITKFSIQQQHNAPLQDERPNENKKVPNFKIKNRPHSSQFNATAYLPKSTLQSSLPFKKNNALSLNKAKQRKSQVDKKALMRMRQRKQEQANTYYNDYHEFKDCTNQEFPSIKVNKNEISPVSKKKIQFKNEVLYPLNKAPFQIGKKQGKAMQLQKKPSRKLIIKASQRKNVEFIFRPSDLHDENTDPSKKQELNVEEYETEKTIEKVSVSQIQAEQMQEEQKLLESEVARKVYDKPQELNQEVHTQHQQLPPPNLIQNHQDNIQSIIAPTSQHSLQQQLKDSKKEQSQPFYQQPSQNLIERKDALFDQLELRDTYHNQPIENQYPSDDIIEQKQQEQQACKHQLMFEEHQEIQEANLQIKESQHDLVECPDLQDQLKGKEENDVSNFDNKPQTDKEIAEECDKIEEEPNERQQEAIRDQTEKVQEENTVQPLGQQEQNTQIVMSEKILPALDNEPTPIDMKQPSQPQISINPLEQPTERHYELDAYEETPQVQTNLMSDNSIQEGHSIQQQTKETDQLIKNEVNQWLQEKYANCVQDLKEEEQIEQVEEAMSDEEEQAMIQLPQHLESIVQKETEEEVNISENNEQTNSADADNLPSFPPGPIQELPTNTQPQKDISIHNIPQSTQNADPPTLKSLPNQTQSSISLTNQVHSQLNCIYEDIEAKIEAKLSVEESH